jgi:tetratricopeptide (TPR) repeat protein
MINTDPHILIEKFVHRNISDEELAALKEMLKDNETLAALFNESQITEELLKDTGTLQFRESLIKIEEDLNRSARIKKKRFRITIWSASAASILILAVFFLVRNQSAKTCQDLFAENYSKYKSGAIIRGDNDQPESINSALVHYDLGNYAEASTLLEKYNTINPDTLSMISFYKGMIFLEKRNADSAVFCLTLVSPDNSLYYSSLWYKGLGLLYDDQKKEAMIVFRKISETEQGCYRKEAEKIVLELEELLSE